MPKKSKKKSPKKTAKKPARKRCILCGHADAHGRAGCLHISGTNTLCSCIGEKRLHKRVWG